MIYKVRARLKTDTAAALQQRLLDGSIRAQKPDGEEIVGFMERAVVTDSGWVEGSILCYCSTPLAHERATVLDQHFEDLSTQIIDAHDEYEGEPFRAYLERSVQP